MLRCVLGGLVLAATGCHRVFDLDERSPDAAPAVQKCFGTGSLALCLVEPPPEAFAVPAGTSTKIDTTTVACAAYTGGEPDLCVVAATTISIAGDLEVIGTPALVLAGETTTIAGALSLTGNAFDPGPGSQPPECEPGVFATAQGGGGAGGSFGGRGGAGGGGNGSTTNGGTSPPSGRPTRLRGGCHGRYGHPGGFFYGRGGGAVAILSTSIEIEGTLNASGTGGIGTNASTGIGNGATGGGSGGMIVLDAAAISITGQVFANGGGGGEGGATTKGENGTGAPAAMTPAPGGTGGSPLGGDGGAGAAGTELDGRRGENGTSTGGGGGGGGGAGVIRMTSTPTGGGAVSPPPT